jgi:hypothetical protein
MSKPICGFFAPEGRDWEQGLAENFAGRCQVEGQPLCFRVHIWDRDWPEALKAKAFADSHGMTFYPSIVCSMGRREVEILEGMEWSAGNGHDWEAAALHSPAIQDDSGPVGAMKIMRHRGVGARPLLFHAYGQTGFVPGKMLPTLKAEAEKRSIDLIWSECHWGFPGKDKNMGDRPDVTSAEGGAWVLSAVTAALLNDVPVAIYTPKFFFDDSHQPNAAGRVFFGYEAAKPLKAPTMKSWKMMLDLAVA